MKPLLSNSAATYYDTLGVDPSADSETIKRAYRLFIKQWHPDINPERRDLAEEVTKRLTEAYAVLSDPEKRARYDGQASGDVRAEAGPSHFHRAGRPPGAVDLSGWSYPYDRYQREWDYFTDKLGLDPDTWGARHVKGLVWGRDGTFYLSSMEKAGALNDPPTYFVSAFSPFRRQRERRWKWGKEIFGEATKIAEDPTSDRLAIAISRKSQFSPGLHQQVVLVFAWDSLIRDIPSSVIWDPYREKSRTVPDEHYNTFSYVHRAESAQFSRTRKGFTAETEVYLPGCLGCLVLPNPILPNGRHDRYEDMAWSMDGKRLILVDTAGTVVSWDLANHAVTKHQMPWPAQDKGLRERCFITLSPGGFFAAVSYPRGLVLPRASRDQPPQRTPARVEVWDVQSGRQRAELIGNQMGAMTWDAHGNLLLVRYKGTSLSDPARDLVIWKWDQPRSLPEQIVKLGGEDGGIGWLAISPDGQWLAMTRHNGRYGRGALEVIDLATRASIKVTPLEGYRLALNVERATPARANHDLDLSSLAWAPDGVHLATGGYMDLTIWRVGESPRGALPPSPSSPTPPQAARRGSAAGRRPNRHSRAGLEEQRGMAIARDLAVAAWDQAQGAVPQVAADVAQGVVPVLGVGLEEFAPLLLQAGFEEVAVVAEGPVASSLEALVQRLSPPVAGHLVIGDEATVARFFADHPERRRHDFASETDLLALVGLEDHALPPVVAEALERTREFLNRSAAISA